MGQLIQCELVVAAEGRNSPLRDQAGIPVTRIPYRQTAIVCAVAHDWPHHDVALEHFLPAGPFAALPMGPSTDAEPGGAPNVSAIVWTERTKDAVALMALDDDVSRGRLAGVWGHIWGRSVRWAADGATRCRR